jgi:hypothetical protein
MRKESISFFREERELRRKNPEKEEKENLFKKD